jgi:hypothetical protein
VNVHVMNCVSGQASRECYKGVNGGVWGVPDMTRCATDAMKKLKNEVQDFLTK